MKVKITTRTPLGDERERVEELTPRSRVGALLTSVLVRELTVTYIDGASTTYSRIEGT